MKFTPSLYIISKKICIDILNFIINRTTLFTKLMRSNERFMKILQNLKNNFILLYLNVGGELLLGGAYSDSVFLKQILIFPICTSQ